MKEKEENEKIMGTISFNELDELVKKTGKSNKQFKEQYDAIVAKYAGNIVAVSADGKIASIPFTDNILEAKKNFEVLKKKLGEENMGTASISYIPKPDETLLL